MKGPLLILLTGIAIGLLIAPAKGSETWKRIMKGLDDYKDKVNAVTEDVSDNAEVF